MAGRKAQATLEEDNPFGTADAWDVSLGKRLEDGDFLVQIVDIDGSVTAGTGSPAAKVRFENNDGYHEANVYYNKDFFGKIVGLIDAAGVDRPKTGEFDPNDNYRLSQEYLNRLVGRYVGIVVRPEFNEKKGRTYQQLQGVVSREKIEEALGEKGARTSGPPPSSNQVADEDIPF